MGPSSRSSIATLISAVGHGLAALALIMIARATPPGMPRHDAPLVFVKMGPLPILSDVPLILPALEPEKPLELSKAPEPLPAPAPAPAAHPAPPLRVEATAPPPPAKVEAPKPTSVPVTVGLFSDAPAQTRVSAPPKRVEAAGFDTPDPVAKSPTQVAVAAAFGAFDQRVEASSRPRAVGVVAAGGFGESRADAAPPKPAPATVQSSGFDEVRQAPAPARAQPKADPDEPVEITFKPAPVYTPEARSMKLEGDVLLDVEFSASGQVRVIGVTRGLGHGLDEAAVRAAAAIRFKPARSAGRPIDFRTTVHIVFRLA